MLEVASLLDDLLLAAQTLQGLADVLAVQFVGLDGEVAEGLPVLALEDGVGDLGEGGPGPQGNEPLDGVLEGLVQAFGDDRDDLGRGSQAGGRTAH